MADETDTDDSGESLGWFGMSGPVRGSDGQPLKFKRMTTMTCTVCARGIRMGVLRETGGADGSSTLVCPRCGAQQSMLTMDVPELPRDAK